jgi:predicted nucleotidyltransferase
MKQSFTPTDENGYFHSRQNSNSEMNQEVLLKRVKQAVHEVEPDAQIILYGSRSRKEATPGSD